ncbi:MAG: hypothetical protein V7K71_02020 [Nostoc sp.]|uniref:hypothetical protein n=1 Tax=unclassified Nostoc TaxID=2593658 RepID=UPI002AD4A028|nr:MULTISPECIES: hypothetical protein [unclassified Nostoc]MDZ8128716.1 hypothetical protein [Nostoc sp. DedQUE07]MDZ8260634.1 hypothetical protein [Nostoc sp. ChiQUE01b]
MRGNIISFRFDDAELEALQALQTPEDKSPSQTAARLVRGSFSRSIAVSTKTPDVDVLEAFKQEVAASFSEVRSQLEELRGKLKAR